MASWREFLKRQLLKRGMIISRPPGQFSVAPVKLAAAKARGLDLSMVVDGGAATGGFVEEVRQVYPRAKILCIEPRDEPQDELRRTATKFGDVTVAQTLIGDKVGDSVFYEHENQSSMLPDARGIGAKTTRHVDTIDNLIATHRLPPPDFIKLDLQGAELLALTGAAESLRMTQAVQLEVSFMPHYEGQPLAADIVIYMKERGFRLYDVFSLFNRPLDGALAAGDFFFLREGHPLLKDARWDATSR